MSWFNWFRRTPRDPVFLASQPAQMLPQLWFCPTPGALDLATLLQTADPALAHVFQLYAYHAIDDAVFLRGDYNEWRDLKSSVAACRLALAVETGAVKPQQVDTAIIENNLRVFRAASENGSPINFAAIDEPFTAGMFLEPVGQRQTMEQVADRTVTIIQASAHGDTRFGLIEAFPAFRAHEIIGQVDALSTRGWRPAFLHVDVDYNAVKQGRMQTAALADLRRLLADVQGDRQIPLGVCVWGWDERNEATWFRSAETLMGFYQQCFVSGEWPAHVIVQSWAAGWQDPLGLPRSIPSATALWAFLGRIRQSLS